MIIFSGVFYAVFARFREQACILACPYGRVMSALIDRRTITVTYDRPRGEPRGKLLHSVDAPAAPQRQGDCVDCHQCVTVCPTGIDIRNGLQLECVNCTACMDARVYAAAGPAARVDSTHAGSRGHRTASRWMTGRVKAYATVLGRGVGRRRAASRGRMWTSWCSAAGNAADGRRRDRELLHGPGLTHGGDPALPPRSPRAARRDDHGARPAGGRRLLRAAGAESSCTCRPRPWTALPSSASLRPCRAGRRPERP